MSGKHTGEAWTLQRNMGFGDVHWVRRADDPHGPQMAIVPVSVGISIAHLITAAPETAAERDLLKKQNVAMLEALKGKDPDWLQKLFEFLLSQFEAEPGGDEAVTGNARPHFEALGDFMAARDAAILLAEPEATDATP